MDLSATVLRARGFAGLWRRDDLRGASPRTYPRAMIQPLALLLVLASSPLVARAAAPGDDDATAKQRFNEGKYLEAAHLWETELKELPESPDNRKSRNMWATRAVNSYHKAFMADPTQCTVIAAGLAVADDYLATLMSTYGAGATGDDEYTTMLELRGKLEGSRAQQGCPLAKDAPAIGVEPAQAQTTPPPATADATSSRRKTRGLAIGLGVSAAVSAGMAVGSIVFYTRLKPPDGQYYMDLHKVYLANGLTGKDCSEMNTALIPDACGTWKGRGQGYIAMKAMAGVFAVGTAVLTGLLIHHRRKSGPSAALLRRHQVQVGATPHRGGGASLMMGFSF